MEGSLHVGGLKSKGREESEECKVYCREGVKWRERVTCMWK